MSVHKSYGLPRVAHEYRRLLEHKGIRVRLKVKKKGMIHSYEVQVPSYKRDDAARLLEEFKDKKREM
ncbi:hypothetical protein [Brevibacillus dissolubilis]|uniref:hypothetical protein n=1 Tax=Brevibacillus dissolubilis TaxID=1844116 RepID=UPI0021003BFD|nr:hypothetical protein [Brevibacillus dissolubilis]